MAKIDVEIPDDNSVEKSDENYEQELSSNSTPNRRINIFNTKAKIAIISLLLLLMVLGVLVIDAKRERGVLSNNVTSSLGTQTSNSKSEGALLRDELNLIMELTSDEIPSVATVVDASKIHDQPFFVQAKNGDKVLLFTKSNRAILYRPESKKIVEILPISFGQTDTGLTTQ